MPANWNAQATQRRRRFLIDDANAPGATDSKRTRDSAKAASASDKDQSRRSYEPQAVSGQPRVTDLIPRKRWVIALLMFVWSILIAGIVYLHLQLDQWSDFIGRRGLAPIDLAGAAGVATWFSSATLLLAAIGSWQVYNVRRHKTDDYRGTYRLWFWTTAWLVVASLEATAGLHLVVQELAVNVSGSHLAANGDLWWILGLGIPSLALAGRLVFEMWQCKAAVTLTAAAGIAYVYAAVFQVASVPLEANLIVVHHWAAVLTGHSLVLATIAFYARHVLLDALGEAGRVKKSRKPRRKRRAAASSEPKSAADGAEQPTNDRRTKTDSSTRKTAKDDADQVSQRPDSSSAQPAETSKVRKAKQSRSRKPAAKTSASQTAAESGKPDKTAENERVSRKKSKRQMRREQATQTGDQPEQSQTAKSQEKPSKQLPKKPAAETSQRPKPAEPVPDFAEIEDEQPQARRLTKAERRKMRKLRRNESRRAA